MGTDTGASESIHLTHPIVLWYFCAVDALSAQRNPTVAPVLRFRARLLRVLFCALALSHLGEPDRVGIGICMAEERALPVAALRGEAKAERDAEVLYFKEETVSIAARLGCSSILCSSTSIQN